MILDRRVLKLVIDRLYKEADLLLVCPGKLVGNRYVRWLRIYRWVINCELIIPSWEERLMNFELLLGKRFASKKLKKDKRVA